MRCKECGKQKILIKNNNGGKMMWVNLSSLSPEEIRELQTLPDTTIRYRPGFHILHFVTCEENNDISKKQKPAKRKGHFSS